MDNGLYTCIVMIDLHKAFDTINHSLSPDKFQALVINNISVSWFDSYLTKVIQETLGKELCALSSWLVDKKLSLNLGKK